MSDFVAYYVALPLLIVGLVLVLISRDRPPARPTFNRRFWWGIGFVIAAISTLLTSLAIAARSPFDWVVVGVLALALALLVVMVVRAFWRFLRAATEAKRGGGDRLDGYSQAPDLES